MIIKLLLIFCVVVELGYILAEGEECEGADGITGVCTLPERCRSQKYEVMMLPSCSVSFGSRIICCPKTNNLQSFRRRRYTWQRAPYLQTQQPMWHYGYNTGYTHQTHYNGYRNPPNGYNYQNWDDGNYYGYPHQNDHSGHNNDHATDHNYNNGHNHQNWHDNCDHDHADQNWQTSDNNHNEHENSNHNFQDGYNAQHIKNSNIGNSDSNLQNVKTTQNPVTPSQNAVGNSADRTQGHTPVPTSQTPGFTEQSTGNHQNKDENSNHNLQNDYNGQYIQNSNIGNSDSNFQNVKTTQNPVPPSQNTVGNSADRIQGNTPVPTSQTPGVTMQGPGTLVKDTTSVPLTGGTLSREPNPVPSALSGIRISERKCVEYLDHMKNLTEVYNVGGKSKCYDNPNVINEQFVYFGKNATVAEFPHMVALGWPLIEGGFDFKCGGTLISESFILTAGHCLSAPNRDNTISSLVPTIVRLGDFILDDAIRDGANPITREVKRTIKHPSYEPPTRYFDLGLVEMAQKVGFTLEIRPACLWTESGIGSYKYAVVSGWGKLSFTGKMADVLQQAALELFENPFCAPLLESVRDRNWKTGLADSQLCAGDLKKGTDTCQGDSGSALAVAYRDNQCLFFVMGVTSFGRPCGTLNSPGIYTRVSSFVEWIESVVWKDAVDDMLSV